MRPLLLAAILLTAPLAGCDLLLVGATAPGIMPGFGRPLTGRVLDASTGLPVGRATVGAGWGFATTDAEGRFSVNFDFSGGKTLSVSRAGYVSMTQDIGHPVEGGDFYLQPIFTNPGTLGSRKVSVNVLLLGTDGNTPITANGNVSLAGYHGVTNTQTGRVTVGFTDPMPGTIYSGVLAGGQVNGGPIGDANAQFTYASFGYRLIDLPTLDTTATESYSAPLQVQNVGWNEMALAYKGLSAYGSVVPSTEISLDFGMLGSVPVARGSSSGQNLRVPAVERATYVVQAKVTGTDGRSGEVTEVTNLGQVVTLQFLAPPAVIEPKKNASGVGMTPTFAWEPVSGANFYRVTVMEDQGGSTQQRKWVGTTTNTRISYPGFWESDFNGGFLYAGATYSWTVEALAEKDVTYKDGKEAMLSFRRRYLASRTGGMRFTR